MLADDGLWEEFAAESEEHLDTVERILSASWQPGAPEIAALFRAFHSLKGMSGALGALGMETVAHRCEDLLGLARQGRLVIAGTVVDALLAAVDALRLQRAEVIATRSDAPAPRDVLERLAAEAGSATAPPLPDPALTPAGGSSITPLTTLVTALAAAAPRLAALAQGKDGAAVRLARALANQATEKGLPRLGSQLAAIAALSGPAVVPELGRLRRQLLLLREATGEEAGAAALAEGMTARAEDAGLRAALAALAVLLEQLSAGDSQGAAVAGAAREAAAVAAALGLDALEGHLLALEDLADRIDEPDAAAFLATETSSFVERLRQCAEDGLPAMRGLQRLGDLQAGDAAGDLPPEFAPVLGPAGRQRIGALLEEGRRLYRVRIFVPSQLADEEALRKWLAELHGEILASRTQPHAKPPVLDLLIASALEPEALEASRAALDPAGRIVPAVSLVRGPAAESAPAPVRTTTRVHQETIDGIIALEAEVQAAAFAMSDALQAERAEALPATLSQLASRVPAGVGRELLAVSARLHASQERLREASSRLTAGLRRLDEAVLQLRVVPVGSLFARLPRVVRSVAQAAGKQVELALEGEDARIDRSLLELLADPVLHLVRNAVDHGIETPEERRARGKPERGVLTVRAVQGTGGVRFEVADDGGGIDRAAVIRTACAQGLMTEEDAARLDDAGIHALLFQPGFSTADRVSETSGRGVGLDVVADAVRQAGGTLEVSSTPGQGTVFALSLPSSAAMRPVLLVDVAGHAYALPAGRVEAVLDGGAEAEGQDLRVVCLARLLGLPEPSGQGPIIVARREGREPVGLSVSRVQRRTELLLRPLHPALAALPGIGGVGVLGSGEPVVVLEPDGIDA